MENSNLLSILRRAHETALQNIEQLQLAIDDLGAGDIRSAIDRLKGVLTFFEEDLTVHFYQEENLLFPALEPFLAGPGPIVLDGEEPEICEFLYCASLCRLIGPLAVYLRDHEALRQSSAKLRNVAEELNRSRCADVDSLHRAELAVRQVQWLLTSHIARETEALLPKAEEVLSPDILACLASVAAQRD